MNAEQGGAGDALRAAYRRATLACPLQGEGCPSAEELAATARGELDPAQRERLLAILGTCTRCASLVQVAAELAEPAPAAPPHPRRAPAWPWWGAAAAALLVVVVAAPWRTRGPEPTRGAAAAIDPPAHAHLRAAPAELRWAAPARVSCRATLRTAAAEVLAQSDSRSDGRFVLDAATRLRLARGEFLWTVDCGIARLGPFGFTVSP